MRYLYLILISVILTGCGAKSSNIKTEEVTSEYRLPDSMKDCTVHELRSSDRDINTVIHCPNARTTSNSQMVGKYQQHNTVISRQQPPADSKEECEAALPRNQECVAVWAPAPVESK